MTRHHLLIFIFLLLQFFAALKSINAQQINTENNFAEDSLKAKLIEWKDGIKKSTFNKGGLAILNFPEGNISQNLWAETVLSEVQSKSTNMRTVLALIIGNKRIYADTSIKTLVKLLRDDSDIVAINAMYALASFGKEAIPHLLKIINTNPLPYAGSEISSEILSKKDSDFHRFYGFSIDYDAFLKAKDEDAYVKEEVFSRDAFRAIFCLRQLGDSLFPFLKQIKTVLPGYTLYLLDAINFSREEFAAYYNEIIKLKKWFKAPDQYGDSEDNEDFINAKTIDVLFKKLALNFTKDTAIAMLKTVDTSLLRKYNDYLESGNYNGGFNYSAIQSSLILNKKGLNTDTLFAELNKISLRKDAFKNYKDVFLNLLDRYVSQTEVSEKYDSLIIALLIIANIGDSALPLESKVLPYTKSQDGTISYLAMKCLINMHLASNSSYSFIDPRCFLPGYFFSYKMGSNEFMEGLQQAFMQKMSIKFLTSSFHNDFTPDKLFLDNEYNITGRNLRSFNVGDAALLKYFSAYSCSDDERIRAYIAYTLGLADSLTGILKAYLVTYLDDENPDVQYIAAKSLLNFETNLNVSTGWLAHFIIMERKFSDYLSEDIEYLTYGYDVRPLVYAKGGAPSYSLPSFVLPPPKPSLSGLIEPQIGYSTSNTTLADIYKILHKDLFDLGYTDQRIFKLNDGFILLTKIERLNEDGTVNYKDRWNTGRLKPSSLQDYFTTLFFGQEGFFRGAMFIISKMQSFENFGKPSINSNDYNSLFEKGGYTLTGDLASLKFIDKNIVVFIYEYSKNSSGEISSASNIYKTFLSCFQTFNMKYFTAK